MRSFKLYNLKEYLVDSKTAWYILLVRLTSKLGKGLNLINVNRFEFESKVYLNSFQY